MEKYLEVEKKNLKELLKDYNVMCCKIRNSRIKSKQLAILEMIMLNYEKDVCFIKNPPLGDVKGIISFFVRKSDWNEVVNRLKYLGYSNRFFELSFNDTTSINETDILSINRLNWKGLDYSLLNLFEQDEKKYEQQSPHNREFKIISNDGTVKTLEGYRGDGSEFGRRALPVEDARCMVNLSVPFRNKNIIDPFAGGGGIIYMYKYINPTVTMTSIDIESVLKPGLEFYGSTHHVGNASETKINKMFDALVTEVPFNQKAVEDIKATLSNMYNNLNKNAIIVFMCSSSQSEELEKFLSANLESNLIFKKQLNRKGTDVAIQIWTKDKELSNDLTSLIKIVKEIY